MDLNVRIEELKLERARFLAFAFARAELLIEIDRTGIITFASGAAQSMVGMDPKQLLGANFGECLAPSSKRVAKAITDAASASLWVHEHAVRLTKGTGTIVVSIAGCPLPQRPDRFYLSIAHDGAAATPLMTRDSETGLLDSRSFSEAAQRALSEQSDTEVTMTMVDVEGLNSLAERVAGQGGDVLKDIGQLLSDIAGGRPASRLGDSKFGVIHDGALGQSGIEAKIVDLTKRRDPTGQGASVRASNIALDTKGLSDADVGRALAYAVTQFVEAQPGGFTLESLSNGLQGVLSETVAKVDAFRTTLANDGYDLVFQPIVDLHGRAIHHQEALSRLPDGSSPFAMVTFAEQVGFITEFDLMVLRKSLKYLADYPNAYDVAINVSGRSLESQQFITEFLDTMKRNGDRSGRLLIEITESSKITRFDVIDKVVRALRGLGNKVCIDDFGSGSAAFHYLRELSVDVVKIDGSFIKDIERSARDRAFVSSIISLCKELQLETVGEYVETAGQVQILNKMGLDHGQGYLFGKPSKSILQRPVTKAATGERELDKISKPVRWI